MFKTFAFAATALTLASGSAFAAPSDDARTHFQAIASGDTHKDYSTIYIASNIV